MSPSSSGARKFKVKLASGRVLGPLDLQRVRLLILKAQIQGVELAREYPDGEWQDINAIPQIGELLVKHAQEILKADPTRARTSTMPSATVLLPGATNILAADQALPLPEAN